MFPNCKELSANLLQNLIKLVKLLKNPEISSIFVLLYDACNRNGLIKTDWVIVERHPTNQPIKQLYQLIQLNLFDLFSNGACR